MKKKIPNILTSFRLFLVPLFFIILVSDYENSYLLSLLIFSLASITDFFDGKLARKYDAISKFGLFMDPLADKALTLSAFIGFLYIDTLATIVEPWMIFVIFSRDILVTFLRLIMNRKGLAMVTSKIAKLKTASQLISIILILLFLSYNSISPIDNYGIFIRFLMISVTLLTIYTGLDYCYKNIKLMLSK